MNHDSPNTPVFLRFINMIVNDAIVQLDEALQVCYTCANISTFIISLPLYVKSVATIREEELLKDSGEWESLSKEDKQQHRARLDEASMYAKNRNLLSVRTVNTLGLITQDITKLVSATMLVLLFNFPL